MAKVTGPLFSTTARGQIGKSLIYSSWHGIKYVKKYAVPTNPNTPAQQAVRQKFLELINFWKSIYHEADGKSPQWENARMLSDYYGTSFNLFLSNYLSNRYPDVLFTHHLEVTVSFHSDRADVNIKGFFLPFNYPEGKTVLLAIGNYPNDVLQRADEPIVLDGSDFISEHMFYVSLDDYATCNSCWLYTTNEYDYDLISGAAILPAAP